MPVSPPAEQASLSEALAEALEHHLPGLRFVVGGLAIALGIAALHFGKPLLAPLVMAALLAFALAPAVSLLRRWRMPHIPAVMIVIAGLVSICVSLGFVIGQQALGLSRDLPAYQDTVRHKLRELRPSNTEGPWADGLRLLGVVEVELDATRRALAPKATALPQRVQVEPVPPPPLRAMGELAAPILLPLAQIGLMLVLLFFMLLQRHEIRDRLLRLLGQDLTRSAETLSEAGERVSRYLVAQVMVNTSYALPLGLGLWLIGVPGAWLWGLLGGALRFVPYLGPVVASICPLLLAFAVDPGWSMVLLTLALIVSLELLLNNVIEPLAYGQSTGVSSLAVLLSAGFWSLVWGLEGLAIATPLTVCLLVLGRDLGPLRMLDPLLGAEPVFDPPTRLHQRLASGDLADALEQADDVSTPDGLLAFYDGAAIGALQMLEDEARVSNGSAMGASRRQRVVTGMARMLKVLQHEGPECIEDPALTVLGPYVLCFGARTEVDNLSAQMMAHLLRTQGVQARAVSATALGAEQIAKLSIEGAGVVCLCSFHPAAAAQSRFALRHLRRRYPNLPLLLAAWSSEAEAAGAGSLNALLDGVHRVESLMEACMLAAELTAQAAAAAEAKSSGESVASYQEARPEPIPQPIHEV
jgi:predicted PurR-regulated permease PerM